jgi:hypothetical protein
MKRLLKFSISVLRLVLLREYETLARSSTGNWPSHQ